MNYGVRTNTKKPSKASSGSGNMPPKATRKGGKSAPKKSAAKQC